MTTVVRSKILMKRTNRTRAEVILSVMAEMTNGRIIPDGKDTIRTAAMADLGINGKTLVPLHLCLQQYRSFYSVLGNSYPGYGASSFYGQQQDNGTFSFVLTKLLVILLYLGNPYPGYGAPSFYGQQQQYDGRG